MSKYDKFIDKFMPSKDMCEYLKKQGVNGYELVNLIFKSPKPIDDKLVAFEALMNDENDEDIQQWCKEYINAIKYAKERLETEGVFEVRSYLIHNQKPDECYDGLFLTFEHLNEYMEEEKEECEIPNDAYYFYMVEKWEKNSKGYLDVAITYYFVKDEIWYFVLGLNQETELGVKWDTNNFDLNISTPFKEGDIVEFDNYPFNKKTYSIILYADNDFDCCSPWNMYLSGNKTWSIGAVEHGHVGFYLGHFNYFFNPIICPVYSAKLYDGKLPKRFKLLEEIKQVCANDKEKYNKLDKYMHYNATEQEVMDMLRCIELNEKFVYKPKKEKRTKKKASYFGKEEEAIADELYDFISDLIEDDEEIE